MDLSPNLLYVSQSDNCYILVLSDLLRDNEDSITGSTSWDDSKIYKGWSRDEKGEGKV